CGLGDCTYCYMSTVKDKIQDPKKARRRFSSILAEVLISKQLGWELEFLSGGYETYSIDELLFLVKCIHSISGKKQWLNIGTMSKKYLEMFSPYVEGYAGTIETSNWKLRKKVCPSKKLEPILRTFDYCDDLGLKKAMTFIVGLGETIDDFENLEKFIKEKGICRITFYALNPHPGTCFKKSPGIDYYEQWIAKTRIAFPKLDIIAGAWVDKVDYYPRLLYAGANSITKIPSIRKFNTEEVKEIEKNIKSVGRVFKGSLTKLPDVNWHNMVDSLDSTLFNDELKSEIKKKLDIYLKQMRKN
ncbi:radical SAM protein, partial [Candidatus Woesearchaeota archaeon]|nr:radical SAM protein [Candidatus Woesearchaeota archaeon]